MLVLLSYDSSLFWFPPDDSLALGDPDRAAGQDVEGVPHGALPHDVLPRAEHLGLQHVPQLGQHHAPQSRQQRHALQEVDLEHDDVRCWEHRTDATDA